VNSPPNPKNVPNDEAIPSIMVDTGDFCDQSPAEGVFYPMIGSEDENTHHFQSDDRKERQPQINCPSIAINRFSKWAYRSDKHDRNNCIEQLSKSSTSTKISVHIPNVAVVKEGFVRIVDQTIGKKRQRSNVESETTQKVLPMASKYKKDFIPMKLLSVSEQESEIQKWHSLTTMFTSPHFVVDTPYTIEDRRYHMLLATLLHARCQEPTVRVAIIQLVNYFQLHDVPITVQSMTGHYSSNNNQKIHLLHSDLVPLMKNLQYYNSKVKYILQSSHYIWDHCHGIVPNTENELRQLPGIGPLFADLLCTINTKQLHEKYLESKESKQSTTPSTNLT
jgi:endonuclease III